MGRASCRRIHRVSGRRGKFRLARGFLFRFGHFLDAMDILVGNFPTEITALAALFDVLLEENGAAGIRGKKAGGRQQDITHSILHGDTTAQELRIRRHPSESVVG